MENSPLNAILEEQVISLKKLNDNMLHEEEMIISNEIDGLQNVMFCREVLIDEMRERKDAMVKEMKKYKDSLENFDIKSLFYQLEYLVEKLNLQNDKNQLLLKVRASL